MIEIDYFKTL